MYQMENLERASNLSNDALQHMAEQEIPPTPSNFLVWYEYCRGGQPQLKQALDILISNKASFTPERSEEIHARFFAGAAHPTINVRKASHNRLMSVG